MMDDGKVSPKESNVNNNNTKRICLKMYIIVCKPQIIALKYVLY